MSDFEIAHIPSEQLERANSLMGLVITTSAEEMKAINGLTFVQSVLKGTEKSRKELVKPINDEVSKINTSYKILQEPFRQAENNLKQAMLAWRQAEQRRIEEERIRIVYENAERERIAREAAEKARVEAEELARKQAEDAGLDETEVDEWVAESTQSVPEVVAEVEQVPEDLAKTTKGTIGSINVRKTWDFEVTNQSEIPRAYCVPDEKRIRVAVRAGVRDIPGVRIFEKETIAGGR